MGAKHLIVGLYRQLVRVIPESLKKPMRPLWYKIFNGAKNFIHWLSRYMPFTDLYKKRRWIKKVYNPVYHKSRRDVLVYAIKAMWTNRPVEGYYFEFGSHTATTVRLAYDNFRHIYPSMKFVCFDSFQGLPPLLEIDKMDIFQEGANKTSRAVFEKIVRKHGIPEDKMVIVEGFYKESLNDHLKFKLQPTSAAFIYIDVDIYSATKEALDFSKDFLQPGTVLMFGNWNCFYGDPDRGQRRAFREFCEGNPELIFSELTQSNSFKLYTFVRAGKGAPSDAPN